MALALQLGSLVALPELPTLLGSGAWAWEFFLPLTLNPPPFMRMQGATPLAMCAMCASINALYAVGFVRSAHRCGHGILRRQSGRRAKIEGL